MCRARVLPTATGLTASRCEGLGSCDKNNDKDYDHYDNCRLTMVTWHAPMSRLAVRWDNTSPAPAYTRGQYFAMKLKD